MLRDKILLKKNGIVLYGMTPPKSTNSQDELEVIAKKHINRLKNLDIDALVLYDIQDETQRTNEKRPFPFMQTIDPDIYSKKYLNTLNFPSIIYKAIGKYTKEELKLWIKQNQNDDSYCVFVGAASYNQKLSMTMKDAYTINDEINSKLLLGGITIPERHKIKEDEHLRLISKIHNGCTFFITQCVYDLEATKIFLTDYAKYSKENKKEIVPIIITLTPCGSEKTLEFMKWLGINIPNYLEEDLKESSDILEESMKLLLHIFEELFKFGIKKGIPIGCNIESVSIRKEEIDASIVLVHKIKAIIKKYTK